MKLKDLKKGDYFYWKDIHNGSIYVVAEDHGTTIIFSLTNNRVHAYDKYLEFEVVQINVTFYNHPHNSILL